MTRTRTPLLLTLGLLALLPMLGGCQDRLKAENHALWEQNKELQAELDRTRAARSAAENEAARLSAELAALRNAAPAAAANTGFESIEGIETDITASGIAVRVPGDVLFASGKVDLRPAAQQTLSQIAAVIQREYPNRKIRVEGYTDTDPIRKSNWKDNLELSLQRAAAVHRYLQSQGINPDRMYAAGFGEWSPRETKAQSRRVEIVVVLNE